MLELILTNELFKILLAALLGSIIGMERELVHKPAGLRTHMLVALGSCLFMIVSQHFTCETCDPARIAAGVVTGVGFIGAGTIIAEQRGKKVVGITTAASLWATAAIGLAVAIGEYLLAIVATLLICAILQLRVLEGKK